MASAIEMISEYLAQYGWSYELAEEELIVTGFAGRDRDFQIFIQVADPLLLLAITRFVVSPDTDCRARFTTEALRLNYEMNLVKLGFDPDGDVTMLVELPTINLGYEQFALALDTLSYWADKTYRPLLNLARDPEHPSNLTEETEANV